MFLFLFLNELKRFWLYQPNILHGSCNVKSLNKHAMLRLKTFDIIIKEDILGLINVV